MHFDPAFDRCEEPGKEHEPPLAKQPRQFVPGASGQRWACRVAAALRTFGLGAARPGPGLALLASLALPFAVSNAALAQTTVTQSGGGATWSLVGETSLTTGQTYTYTLTLTDGTKPQNELFGLTSSTLGLNRFKRGIDTCSGGYYFCYAMRNASTHQELTVNNVNISGHVLGFGSPYEMTLVVALDTPVGTQVNLGVVDRHGYPRADAMQLTVTEAADTTAPRVSDATVDGASLVIAFDEDLATAANLANSAFTVKKTSSRGEETTVTLAGSPSISGATVTLTLTVAVVSSDAVTVSYAKPTSGMDNALEDAAGNRVARFTDVAVTNNTPNNPPTAADGTVTTDEDTAYAFAASDFGFADADAGDALASVTITALESAGDLELDGTDVALNQTVEKADIDAGKLRFTPAENANGTAYATFRFTVSDGADDSASSYTMTVDVTAVNDPPTVANAIPDQTATEGAAFRFQFAANTFDDVDDNTLTYTAVEDGESALPSWLGFDAGTRTFSGTPASTDVGTVTVKVTASDDDGASVSDAFDITVNAAANNPPTAADGTVTTDEDTAYAFAASDFGFADADAGDALASVTITALESAGDLELDGTDVALNQTVEKADIDAGKLRFTPAENANGTAYATFRFTVSDGADDSASSYAMTVDVTAVNDPPTAANAIPDQSATEGAAFSFQFAANTFDDVDDATLAYAAVEDGEGALPSWLSFDAGTRTFSGTPGAADAGTVTVKVTASDDDGASASDAFDITVNAAVNNPPTAADGTVTTDEDTAYAFAASDFNFADTDAGDALASVTITALESAGDLELDGTDVALNQTVEKADIDAGKLTFTPAANANGTAYATFRFTVSDGADDSSSSYAMTVDVTAVNDPPTVANAIPDQGATEGAAFTYQFPANTFDDVDDATLAYAAVEDGEDGLPSWLGFDAGTRTFSGTPAAADVGTVTVKVTASDDDGASASDAFIITVSAAVNSPATGQPGITGTPQVGQTLTATVGDINDTDGLPTFPGDYRFQWVQVDGGTETDVGTDSHEYAPSTTAIGKAIKVKVTFNDTDGNGEGPLESDETAAVVAMQADCATDRPGNDWCATMTVGVGGAPSVTTYGFGSGQGALSDTTINYGGTLYTLGEIIFVDYRAASGADGFDISISDYLPRGSDFDIGGATLAADASSETTTFHAGSAYSWDAANPGWIDGQKVTVSANLAPVVTAAEVNGHQLVLTFAEDLDANSKPAASAFTVYVNGGAGTNPSSVDTISGKTVTMTLATAVTSGQTVTLDYAVPETNPLRDESELNAPAFTGQTVTNNTPAATNNAPTAADNTVTIDEDTAYTFAASDFNFADTDTGDALASVTITTLESAGDLDLDGTDVTLNQVVTKPDIDAGKLRFTPAENANGSAYATFGFKVSDGTVDSTDAYTMTVDVTAVNDPPTVANAIPDQIATEGAAFRFQFAANTFDDVDDNTLTYTAVEDGESALPSWLGFDAGTRTFSGTPTAADAGTVSVKVTASDDDGASVSDAFVITVSAAANNPATGKPGIDGTPQVGQTLTTTAGSMADDDNLPATTFPEGYSFQWVQVDGPTETEISGATSQTYVPVAADVGRTLKVKVTFTDGGGAEEMLTSDETGAVIALPAVTPTLDSPEAFFANGALRYRFDLRLSEGVSIPHEEMRDHAFSVTNGHMDKAQRIHKQRTGGVLYSNHWRMTVAPDDETKPVTVTLRGNRPCGEEGALCSSSGGWLDGSPTLTLSTETNPPDLGSLPSLSIADTSGTEDSTNLAFDVSLSKAVSATIAVDFRTVSGGTTTANADYQEANHRILFAAGETVKPGSVALIEDAADDAGETVMVEITNGRVITPRGAEFGPLSITRAQATGTIDAPASSRTPLPNVNMRIENTSGSERGGWLHFTIALSRALDEYVCYDFETLGTGTASEAVDYLQRRQSTLWQPPGVTEWTEFVRILDDSIDDGGETVQVRISDAELCDDASKTVTISRADATGTITNSDPIPAAWLARFGRTVADQVIDAVEGRMEAARAPGTAVHLAGQPVGVSGARQDWRRDAASERLSLWGRAGYDAGTHMARLRPGPWGAGPGLRAERAGDPEGTNWHAPQGRGMTARELLVGSSFSLAAGDAHTGSYALWGRGSVSRFDGRAGDVAVDGAVASAFLGADWSRERTTMGLILGHSIGDGGYNSESGRGEVSSTLTGLYPWMRQALGERVSLWSVAGYGEGTLTVTPANADRASVDGVSQAAIRTDLGLDMGAVGLRGTLAQAPDEGGFELAVKTDAMGVRTHSAAVPGLTGTATEVARLRLGLEGSRPFRFAGGAQLRPSVEVAVRQDGGDAETGFGMDVGGGIAWTDPRRGFAVDLRGRGLVTHDSKGFREAGVSGSLVWEPRADNGRGPSLTLTQTMGGPDSGGAHALLERGTLAGLAAHDSGAADGGLLARRRLEVRFGYGLAAFGDRFTSRPELGVELSDAWRDYRLGWRLSHGTGAGSLDLALLATRREAVNGYGADVEPERAVGLQIEARL